MSTWRHAAIAITAALIAVPVYGQSAGFQSNGRVSEVPSGAQQPAVVHIQPQPAIVHIQPQNAAVHAQGQPTIVRVPVVSDTRARASTPVSSERVDEAARAREHARYEAEKRRRGASGVASVNELGSKRLNEHPLMPISRPTVAESRPSAAESRLNAPARVAISTQAQTPEEAKSAEEARAAFLERTPSLSVRERTVAGVGERSAEGESMRPAASDVARAREILSELR